MNELKTLTKNDVKDLTLEELEDLKTKENLYLESGETLLEALLNVSFKSKDKVESIMSKISLHRRNIRVINSRIEEIEISKQGADWSTTGIGTHFIYNSATSPIWSQPHLKYETTEIEYVDASNNMQKTIVMDDVFHSVLGNYYLSTGNSNIPLNRVISIDESSNVGKWYSRMQKNFERETKLNRIVKDEECNDEENS